MAKTRCAEATAQPKEHQAIQPKHRAAAEMGDFPKDVWAPSGNHNGVCHDSPVEVYPPADFAPIKEDEEQQDDIALPTPIAQGMWKVTAPDGSEQLTYQPIPGFEHLLHGKPQSRQPSICYPQPTSRRVSQQTALTNEPVTCMQPQQPVSTTPKRNTLKRSRSVAQASAQTQSQAQDDEEEFEDDGHERTSNEAAYTFYVGDFDQLTKFFRRRLEELTMKPLRPIVTAWIKQLEPRRLGSYGPYHKKMPSQRPPHCTPDWWPRDVRYEEPSHLDKTGLLKVAVTMMLQHRIIDEPKRKGPWVAKLQQAAQYAIETTPPEQFSSSKGSGFSERMRERALNEIMPSLFSIAQLYEDHIAQYNLYEGSGNVDPRQGTTCTWQPVSRPPRQSTFTRKRAKVQPHAAPTQEGSEDAVSSDETEADDAASNHFLRRESAQSQTQQRTPRGIQPSPPVSGAPISPTPTCASAPLSRASTMMPSPISSFDGTMNGLRLHGETDLDVKYVDTAHFTNPNMGCNVFPMGQAMQYSVSTPDFTTHGFNGHDTVPAYSSPAPSPFGPEAAFNHHQFSTFNTPYSQQMHSAAFTAPLPGAHHGFPYDYEGRYSVVPGPPQQARRSFHSLPAGGEMNGQFAAHP